MALVLSAEEPIPEIGSKGTEELSKRALLESRPTLTTGSPSGGDEGLERVTARGEGLGVSVPSGSSSFGVMSLVFLVFFYIMTSIASEGYSI